MDDKWSEQTENTVLVKLDKSATHIYKTLQQAHEEHGLVCGLKLQYRYEALHKTTDLAIYRTGAKVKKVTNMVSNNCQKMDGKCQKK
jgi:hypothetical protein